MYGLPLLESTARSTMKLVIISPNGYPVMWTESTDCFPESSDLQQLKQAGYKFTLDGKAAAVKQITQAAK